MAKQLSVRLEDAIADILLQKATARTLTLTEYLRDVLTHDALDAETDDAAPALLPRTLPHTTYAAPLGQAVIHTTPTGARGMYMVRCSCGTVYDYDNHPRCTRCRVTM